MTKTTLQKFYDLTRKGKLLGPILTADEVAGIDATLRECMARGLGAAQTAYCLATDYHETNGTMQPIKELGGVGYLTRMYDISGARPKLARANGNTMVGDGVRYCGRGKAQITWKNNYKRVGDKIGIDLVNNPGRALDMDVATRILVQGSIEGWFTGRKLSDHLKPGRVATAQQFIDSRPIINGKDKAQLIASYALIFQADLIASGWKL